jgi:hypothetical protein
MSEQPPAGSTPTLGRALLTTVGLAAVATVLVAPWVQIPVDDADGVGMLAHLEGMFVSGDLLYDDEYSALRMTPLYGFVTSAGVVSNHWPVGASFLQAPGWWLGGWAANSDALEHLPAHARHWTVPMLALRAWTMLAVAATLIAIAGWGRRLGLGRVGWAVAGVCLLGSPLLYYATEGPERPHAWGFAVCTALVMSWARGRETREAEAINADTRALLLGALSGLAAAIRPQLATAFALVLHDAWCRHDDLKGRTRAVFISGIAAAPWALLNLSFQAWMFGPDLSHYGLGGVTHHLPALLFSTHHGVFTWSPMFVLAIVGIGVGVAQKRSGAWLLAALLLHQLWLDSGTREVEPFTVLGSRNWFDGTAFAPRKLLDALPLALPGAWWLVEWARERGRVRALAALTAALVLPTLLLHVAAFVRPDTTAEIMTGPIYADALGRGLSVEAWRSALDQRQVPGPVVGAVSVRVFVLLAGILIVATLLRRSRPSVPRGPLVIGLLVAGSGLAAQGWVSTLQIRSDRMLEEQPHRMPTAEARMHGAHVRAIAAVGPSQEHMRSVLGDWAVPPPG